MQLLSELIIKSARVGLSLQRADGSFPRGHNGPYQDPETPLRNAGHWLITMAYAARMSGEERFHNSVRKVAEYMLSPDHRPGDATWLHRDRNGKDRCNGLIGPAWTIEALCTASEALRDDKYAASATEVLSLIPFDESVGMWRTLDVDGRDLGFDPTFNHQLWLAMAASLLMRLGNQRAGEQAAGFLDALEKNLTVDANGLIQHGIGWLATTRPIRTPRQLASFFYRLPRRPARTRAVQNKAIGYHAFNTYAFAVMRAQLPEHPAWSSEKIKQAIAFIGSNRYLSEIEHSHYGYPYNPSGFEAALTLEKFASGLDTPHRTSPDWIRSQISLCFNEETKLMDRGSMDANTQAARIYEATRLSDCELC